MLEVSKEKVDVYKENAWCIRENVWFIEGEGFPVYKEKVNKHIERRLMYTGRIFYEWIQGKVWCLQGECLKCKGKMFGVNKKKVWGI